MSRDTPIGIIGGSGLYQMKAVEVREELAVDTPFGLPSERLVRGTLAGRELIFLARHGKGHRIAPTQLNFRANIYALKSLGVERILSVSAVGSLKEEIVPGHVVVIDQFIDRTRQRVSTFFDEGAVVHVSFADPVCPELRELLISGCRAAGATVHERGTYVCMEGPQFSTKAESHLYRQWGADVIGMTNLQEAKLAREAELCYVTLALSTDYDCWHEGHEAVTVEQVIAVLQKNVQLAQEIIQKTIAKFPAERHCQCGSALKNALLTDRAVIPKETRERLGLLLGRYL